MFIKQSAEIKIAYIIFKSNFLLENKKIKQLSIYILKDFYRNGLENYVTL